MVHCSWLKGSICVLFTAWVTHVTWQSCRVHIFQRMVGSVPNSISNRPAFTLQQPAWRSRYVGQACLAALSAVQTSSLCKHCGVGDSKGIANTSVCYRTQNAADICSGSDNGQTTNAWLNVWYKTTEIMLRNME